MMSLSLTAVEGAIMSKYIPESHKHLTAADRLYIERQLNAGFSFKDIARFLFKDPSTISKELALFPAVCAMIHPYSNMSAQTRHTFF